MQNRVISAGAALGLALMIAAWGSSPSGDIQVTASVSNANVTIPDPLLVNTLNANNVTAVVFSTGDLQTTSLVTNGNISGAVVNANLLRVSGTASASAINANSFVGGTGSFSTLITSGAATFPTINANVLNANFAASVVGGTASFGVLNANVINANTVTSANSINANSFMGGTGSFSTLSSSVVSNANNIIMNSNGSRIGWTGTMGALTQTSNGQFVISDANNDANASLQIGSGSADQSGGSGGIFFGSAGNSAAVNIAKNGAGLGIIVQSGVRGNGVNFSVPGGALSAPIVQGVNNASTGLVNFPAASTGSVTFWAASGALTGPGWYFSNNTATGSATVAGAMHYPVTKTAGYTLTFGTATSDSDKSFNNSGAGSLVNFTLPACTANSAGYHARFINLTAFGLSVTSNGTDTMTLQGVSQTSKTTITTTATGASAELECAVVGQWYAIALQGTFTSN